MSGTSADGIDVALVKISAKVTEPRSQRIVIPTGAASR
ncbi:MAG: hypothetical protein WB622_05050, partial [Acidobacteriaceae bacterium]